MDLSVLYQKYKQAYAIVERDYEQTDTKRGLMLEGTFRERFRSAYRDVKNQYERKKEPLTDEQISAKVFDKFIRRDSFIRSSNQEQAVWRTMSEVADENPDSELARLVKEEGIEGFRIHTTAFYSALRDIIPNKKELDERIKSHSW